MLKFFIFFTDVAVGSYASGHVVLLRSSPVANVSASLNVVPSRLSIDDRSLHVKACLQYGGNYVPERVGEDESLLCPCIFSFLAVNQGCLEHFAEIHVRLQFDSQYIPHRGYWETKHGNTAIHSFSEELHKGGRNCFNFTALIHVSCLSEDVLMSL